MTMKDGHDHAHHGHHEHAGHDHGHAHEQASKARPEVALAASSSAAGTVWTCPMHPEIRRDAPGSCPICGMALEPLAPSAEEGENHELNDMTRRFWVGVVLTLPLLWSMLGELVPAIKDTAEGPSGRRRRLRPPCTTERPSCRGHRRAAPGAG